MQHIEDMKINFPCPACKQDFPVSIYQLLDGGVTVCPWCQTSNVETELNGLEQSLEFFDKALQNLKRCIERRSRTNND